VFVWARRKAAFSKARAVKSGSHASDVTAIDAKTIPNSELRQAMGHFLASADRADVSLAGIIYDNDFLCVRIADDGGQARLNREQMLSFLNQAVKAASGHPRRAAMLLCKTTRRRFITLS